MDDSLASSLIWTDRCHRNCVHAYYTNTSLERVRIYTIIFHIWLICELTSIHVYLANTIQVYSVTVNLLPMLKHCRPNNLARGHLSLLHRTLGCWVEPTQGHVSSLMVQFILSNVQQRRPKIHHLFSFSSLPIHPTILQYPITVHTTTHTTSNSQRLGCQ